MITGFHYVLFTPLEGIDTANRPELERRSMGTPELLGFLSISEPLLEPALEPGNYLVAFRKDGAMPEPEKDKKDKKKKSDEEEEELLPDWVTKIDLKKANLLFFEAKSGDLAAFMEVKGSPEIDKTSAQGASSLISKLIPEPVKGADGKMGMVEMPWLEFSVVIPSSKVTGRSWKYTFPIKPNADLVDQPWRR